MLHSSTLRNPDGIAVDWLGRNLYWCDKTTDTIEVSKLNGLYRKVLIRTGLQEPRALVVHPFRGLLFYTDWGDNAHIGRLGMDGSARRSIVKDHLGWPNSLTIDYFTDHIYWADARLDYIALADLNGENKHYVIKEQLPHIFALTLFGDNIYWTDWEYKSVEGAHKFSGRNRHNVTHTIHRPMDIQVNIKASVGLLWSLCSLRHKIRCFVINIDCNNFSDTVLCMRTLQKFCWFIIFNII